MMTDNERKAIEKIDEIAAGQKRESEKPFTGNTLSTREALAIIRAILCG